MIPADAETIDPLQVMQATSATITFDHTVPTSRTRLPSEHVFTGLAILAALLCIGAGVVIGRYQGAVTVTRTVHTRQTVSQLLGKPNAEYKAETVNPQLVQLGMTVCDMYASKRTMVCH